MANVAAVGIVWVMLWLSIHFPPSLLPSIDVNTLQPPPTTGIQTRNFTKKDKPLKSAADVQPKQQITPGSTSLPEASNVNSLLAKINLPKSQFNGVLTALGSPGGKDDGLNTPCNLVPLGKAMRPQVKQHAACLCSASRQHQQFIACLNIKDECVLSCLDMYCTKVLM
jgi:hypothetical protein